MCARTLPAEDVGVGVLKYIITKGLVDVYPNIFVALRILLTIPVAVASAERSSQNSSS